MSIDRNDVSEFEIELVHVIQRNMYQQTRVQHIHARNILL